MMSGQYALATVLAVFAGVGGILFVFRKPIVKYMLHERLGVATKAEVQKGTTDLKTEMKAEFAKTDEKINAVKTEMKAEFAKTDEKIQAEFAKTDEKMKAEFAKTDEKITSLKENDFFHTNKAILLMATELLKNNPERFERVKDTILETTPENRRDEIKSITLL